MIVANELAQREEAARPDAPTAHVVEVGPWEFEVRCGCTERVESFEHRRHAESAARRHVCSVQSQAVQSSVACFKAHPDMALDHLRDLALASARMVASIDRAKVTWSTMADAEWAAWVFVFAAAGVVLPAPEGFIVECERLTAELNEQLRAYRARKDAEVAS